MGRTKVKLRSRAISQGRESLYLDYYPKIRHPETGKMIRFETLGMYVFTKPKGDFQRRHNETTMMQVEAIMGIRQQAVINQEFGFLDESKYQGDFLVFFRKFANENDKNWSAALKQFEIFTKGNCRFADITTELCQAYKRYIQNAPNSHKPGKTLHINTAANYFKIFKYVVGFAYRDKWLKEDIFKSFDYIPEQETHREFLVPSELLALSRTPCEPDVLKRASLFSCLTGLRLSDVESLEWRQITANIDGTGFNARIRTQKTDKELLLPLSADALLLCGKRNDGLVFESFRRSMLAGSFQRWLSAAGITKHISFHCFRHTYAVLQLASGTDIYTVSRMLGHKHVSTTEVYLDLLEDTKIGTIDKIRIDTEPYLLTAA